MLLYLNGHATSVDPEAVVTILQRAYRDVLSRYQRSIDAVTLTDADRHISVATEILRDISKIEAGYNAEWDKLREAQSRVCVALKRYYGPGAVDDDDDTE